MAGVAALWPSSGASYPNVLGYRSLCTFAPASSLFCFLISGLSCVIRAGAVKRRQMYGKVDFHGPPFVVLAVVLLLAVGSSIWYGIIDSRYPDGTTSATASE
jgi:hypothetical protein